MRIKIYSTPVCPHCVTLKDYLKQNNIPFEDINVAQDQKAAEEMIQKTGQMGVPALVVIKDDGAEEIIIGFDRAKVDEIIIKNQSK